MILFPLEIFGITYKRKLFDYFNVVTSPYAFTCLERIAKL
jgi:hypothetical protein